MLINSHAASAVITETGSHSCRSRLPVCRRRRGAVMGNNYQSDFGGSIRQNSGEGRRGRAAVNLCPEQAGARSFTPGNPRIQARHQGRPMCRSRCSEQDRRNDGGSRAWKLRAARWHPETRTRAVVLCSRAGAMMRALAAATERQPRLPRRRQQPGKGRQPEKKNQRNG